VIERRLEAAGAADFALALYNPASRSRRDQLERAREALLRHRARATPVVVARAVGSDEEFVEITTLATFDADAVDMRTILLVGSSRTRATPDARVHAPAIIRLKKRPEAVIDLPCAPSGSGRSSPTPELQADQPARDTGV
jgi:precorrin-3B methylase